MTDLPPASPLIWLSRSLSVLFHPIWLPLAFAAWQGWGDAALPKLLILTFLLIVAFPGGVAALWMWMRKEQDWYVMAQSNRLIPMVATLIGLAIFALANWAFLPERLFQGKLMALLTLLVLISIVVNRYWKISVHMLSWGAVVAIMLPPACAGGSWLPFIAGLLISGIVAWARIHVGSHDRAQVIVGWLAGIATAGFVVWAFP